VVRPASGPFFSKAAANFSFDGLNIQGRKVSAIGFLDSNSDFAAEPFMARALEFFGFVKLHE
jgi:hypothetical protein